MRLAALALIPLAGCDLVFKVNVPDVCSNGPFVSPMALAGIPQESLFDPTLRDDGLEVFFTRGIAGAANDIFVATRRTTDQAFGPAAPLAFDTLMSDSDAQITLDGLHLLFMTDGQLFEAKRDNRDVPFAIAEPRQDVATSTGLNGFDISSDGTTIYFSRDQNLWVAHRTSQIAAFGPEKLIGPRMDFPSISRDELELFFQNTDDHTIRRVTRASTDAMFDGEPELVFPGEDPEITADGLQLVFTPPSEMGLSIAQRNCED